MYKERIFKMRPKCSKTGRCITDVESTQIALGYRICRSSVGCIKINFTKGNKGIKKKNQAKNLLDIWPII